MSRTSKPDKKPIEQYDHKGKERCNNPPVDLVTPDSGKKTYAYDPHLDPALVWAGKALTQRNRTRMTRIARIFTDPCASASSAQSVFYCTPSAFICVHLRLNKLIFRQMKKEKRDLIMTIEEEGIEIYTNPS